ncbi:hypothetical protein J21TS7_56610 [Paenibacillus cineris]|uniref:Uncharacterized protein n=1 Tax=Paenibacillus cineris TaxID=237530 RepID=A0ABQ4LMV7_9BACL|nr:hypothetical protein J21TS7_56610 [Paenibacillus cineris]
MIFYRILYVMKGMDIRLGFRKSLWILGTMDAGTGVDFPLKGKLYTGAERRLGNVQNYGIFEN